MFSCSTGSEEAANSSNKANQTTQSARNDKVLKEAKARSTNDPYNTKSGETAAATQGKRNQLSAEEESKLVDRGAGIARKYCYCASKPDKMQEECYKKYRGHHARVLASLKKRSVDLAKRFDERYQAGISSCK